MSKSVRPESATPSHNNAKVAAEKSYASTTPASRPWP